MGNSHPQNQTGRKVVKQKLENAKKTGVLSLSEHKLEACPNQVYEIAKLTTLDLSKNKIKTLDPKLANLKVLKSLNVENNKLAPGSMAVVSSLNKLKTLSASHNQLGRLVASTTSTTDNTPNSSSTITKLETTAEPLPGNLPKGLKTILLANNSLSNIPRSILAANSSHRLKLLEKLDLSSNDLATVPGSIENLTGLRELNLDDNVIVNLPASVGKLTKLKVLSLKWNQLALIRGSPQPLPEEIFRDTLLIDLNLHGNPMTTTQLNRMDGYDVFLSRRREVKNKDILGGAMTDLEGCGLE